MSIDSKLKHLELVQGIINRMASNSFLLKGWSVTITSALFALAAKDTNPYFIYLAYFPCTSFWTLDGYFLRQERLYRKLYDDVAAKKINKIDFSMNTIKYREKVEPWFFICFSATLGMFHGAIFGTILIGILIFNYCR